MKNKFVLCLFIAIISILFCETINAQNVAGFYGYAIKSKISTDTNKLNKVNQFVEGFGVGAMYKHLELGPLGVQFEINYEKSGFSFTNDTITYDQDLTYVSIPLLMHADIGKHFVHGLLALGPYINVLLEAPNPETDINTISKNGFSKLYKSNLNRFSYGLMGEAGIAFCTKVGVFQISGRACIGLSNLVKFENVALFNLTLPRTFGFGVGYLVPFGEIPYSTKKDKIIVDAFGDDSADPSVYNIENVQDSTKIKTQVSEPKKNKKNKKQNSEVENNVNQNEIMLDSTETEVNIELLESEDKSESIQTEEMINLKENE
ncbi:MAG: PorT family protein [Bacteroidales bacterium]|nr:PorT family protein [Bacteroidales bacterium]